MSGPDTPTTAMQTRAEIGRLGVLITAVSVSGGACTATAHVAIVDGRLRLIVADPLPSWSPDRRVAGVQAATVAAAVLHAADLRNGLHDANSLLYHPYRKDGPGSCAVNLLALEVDLSGIGIRADVHRAGDGDVWGETDGAWRPLVRTGAITASARHRWEMLAEGIAGRLDRLRVRDTTLTSPEDWESAPLGRFPTVVSEQTSAAAHERVDRLMVITDGFGKGSPDFDALAEGRVRARGADGDPMVVIVAPVQGQGAPSREEVGAASGR